ncbi:hypothetical protein HY620_02360 [Candidatus Uhrbacteria bacterium]|nr:hypothetical protein [Candidatus Uhrbacteria bacterium]
MYTPQTRFFRSFQRGISYLTIASMTLWSLGPRALDAAIVSINITTGNAAVTLGASSGQAVAFSIDMQPNAGENISQIILHIDGWNGFTPADLAPLAANSATSGIALYQDNKAAGTVNSFDAQDTLVPLVAPPSINDSNDRFIKLTPTASAPSSDTSATLNAGDILFTDYRVNGLTTYDWHMVTIGNSGAGGIASNDLRLDNEGSKPVFSTSQVSIFQPAATGLFTLNGASSTTQFSSNNSNLLAGDVVLVKRTGAGTAPLFEIALENAAANSTLETLFSSRYFGANGTNVRMSKISTQSTSVMTIPAHGNITFVGAYNNPQVGDFVAYATTGPSGDNGSGSGNSATKLGIVTNATLAAGVFAVDGVPLKPGQIYRISKVNAFNPSVVLRTSTNGLIDIGSVMYGLTTTVPLWYMVTADGPSGMTSSQLLFNGAGSAPVFGQPSPSGITIASCPNETSTGCTNAVQPLHSVHYVALHPANPVSLAANGVDVFVVIRTSANPGHNHKFALTLPAGTGFGLVYPIGLGLVFGVQLSPQFADVGFQDNTYTPVYTINNPTFTLVGGGPGNGQNFVPDQAIIDIMGSVPINAGTVTTANVSLLACTGTSDANSCPGTTGANLCTSVALNGGTQIVCNHDPLPANTTYRFRIGTGVQSNVGNVPLAAQVDRIFRTGSVIASANTTPPQVMSTVPFAGSDFPASGNLVVGFSMGPDGNMNFNTGAGGSAQAGDLNFCQSNTCALSLKKIENFVPTTEVCTTGVTCVFSWDAPSRQLTINPAANLDVASDGASAVEYDLCVRGAPDAKAVKNSANQSLPGDRCTRFRTVAADTTAPALAAANATTPLNAATNVSPFSSELIVRFSERLNPGTVSLNTVRLCQDSTAGTAGCEAGDTRLTNATKFAFRYDHFDNSARLSPIAQDSLAATTKYCFEVVGGAGGVKDVSGNAFAATTSANCFTTGAAADPVAGAPKVQFADADNFKLVVKFSEPMRPGDLIAGGNVNTTNVALECPTGVVVSLNGKPAQYRAANNELEIQNLGLPVDQTCKATITSASDLAGNAIDTSSSNNIANFKVLNAATTGGFLGGGGIASNDFFGGMGGQTAASFWEKPMRIQPRAAATNKSTSVEVEFPAPGALPIGSTILLTFPSGFTMSNGDGNARLVPTAQSSMNADLNGQQETGVVTATAATDTTGKTVTITTGGAAIASGSMIRFELDRITSPTTAAENLRITAVVKDNTSVKIGQTINPAPFNIQQGGALSISGKVCKGSLSGGTCGGGDTAIANVKVVCSQMGGFMVGATAAAFMGNQEASTDVNGAWSITGLTAGEYSCFLPPDPTRLVDTGGAPPMQKITLASANKTGVEFKYKDMAAAGDSRTLTVTISGGPANEIVDVFCHAGTTDSQFSAPTMKAVTLNGTGGGTATLRLQQDKKYECGVGPHIAFEQFGNGAPPPPPTFTFMPPKHQTVTMSANQALTFAIQTSNRTITGTVVDGSANGIANVYVHAFPVGCFASDGTATDCQGAFAKTRSDGTFTLNVINGTYEVRADGPGLPPSSSETANVKGANVAGLTLKMVKSSTTISGAVKDESGNGIRYAHVKAEKRTITSGTDACDFQNSTRSAGGFADTPTDSSGNFTLYVSNGTWCVRAFAPAYGEVGTKTITVSGSSLTGQHIAATAADFGTISGTVTKSGSNVSGAFVNCQGSTGGNNAQTGADGTYSIKVKLASSGSTTLTCDGYAPGVGSLGRSTITFGPGETTKTKNFTQAGESATITITATGLTEGFCDASDANGFGSGAPIQTGSAVLKSPAGSYTVRCGSHKTGPLTLSSSAVTLAANGTASLTATVPTLRSVTGRVTDGTSNVEGATVTFTDRTAGASFTVPTGNQAGTNTNLSGSNIPEGTYNVKATKKGYEPATTTATVSGGNLTLSAPIAMAPTSGASGENVTILVQASGSAYAGEAKVIATNGTKTIVAETDSTTGNASLDLPNGTWTVKAIGDNGKQSIESTVTVSGGSLSGAAPTLSLASDISGFTAKSGSGTFPLSSGGLLKFNDLEVGGKAPAITIPANTFSTTDSSTASIEMKTDPTLTGFAITSDQKTVGKHGYDITPKDASGRKISDTNNPLTIEIPYSDADVTAAGVEESKLTISTFNTTSQTWETLPTVVDTVNNILKASVSHFSSFGILGSVTAATASAGGSSGGAVIIIPNTNSSTQEKSPTPSPTASTPAPAAKTEAPATQTSTPAGAAHDRVAQLAAIVEEAKSLSSVVKELPKLLDKGMLSKEEKLSLLTTNPADLVLTVIDKVVPASVTRATAAVATKFIADGTPTTMQLGAGERAGVVNSYKAAFGQLPANEAEWQDVVKIANGRFPSQQNEKAEKRAELSFKAIYNRAPDRKNSNDDAAVVVMAYGLRTANRNMKNESAAIKSYKVIFKRAPVTATAWDAVRAIAYSGAKK